MKQRNLEMTAGDSFSIIFRGWSSWNPIASELYSMNAALVRTFLIPEILFNDQKSRQIFRGFGFFFFFKDKKWRKAIAVHLGGEKWYLRLTERGPLPLANSQNSIWMLDSCIWQSDLCMLYHDVRAYYTTDKGFLYWLMQLLKAKATFLIYILRPLPSMSLFFLQCKIVVMCLTTLSHLCESARIGVCIFILLCFLE